MPWIEIDFAADIERANTVILPLILAAKKKRAAAIMAVHDMEHIAPQPP